METKPEHLNKELFGQRTAGAYQSPLATKPLHPAWDEFVQYCVELGHGEIELLKIQDGLPVLAEVVRKKIKFSSPKS